MLTRRRFLADSGGAALALGWSARRLWRPPAPRRILYVAGRLSGQNPAVIRSTVDGLGASAFNVAILAFVYARFRAGRLRLTYNGTPFARLHPTLALELRRLRRDFGAPRTILLSLGGWGNRATFEAIRSAGVEAFLRQLEDEAIAPLGIGGLDLDLEPSTAAENTAAGWHAVHDDLGTTLVEITNRYRARHPDHVVTHAPIASVAAALYARDGRVRGVPGGFFAASRRSGGGNNISWLNVQFYEAGDPKPQSIPDFYRTQLLAPLLASRAATGLAAPWQALAPGFEPRYHQDLAVCTADLEQILASTAAWGPPAGAFLWQYGQIAGALGAWGAGLRRALAGGRS